MKIAATIGFKEAAEIACVHYTTVYDWRRDLKNLAKKPSLPTSHPILGAVSKLGLRQE